MKLITRGGKGARYGRFSIKESAFEDYTSEQVCDLMHGFIILESVFHYASLSFEITAWCDKFDLVPEAEEIPYYKIDFVGNKVHIRGRR